MPPGTTLPAASKEAVVVVTHWPPVTDQKGMKYAQDGSWVLTPDKGEPKKGHIRNSVLRELNGSGLDRAGAQFLDRATLVDGHYYRVSTP